MKDRTGMLTLAALCGLLVAPIAAAASAEQDAATPAATGQQIYVNGTAGGAAACASCHGDKGEGNAGGGYPVLAGMQGAYLRAQLDAYADGDRASPVMQPMAKALDDAQRDQVSAYIAALPRPAQTGTSGRSSDAQATPSTATLERGRTLYYFGKRLNWDTWLPACYLCHGRRAEGAGERFPPLAGQVGDYLAAQLRAWQQGNRSGDPQGLMASIAERLDDEDIDAISSYLAAFARAPEPVWPFKAEDTK